jgi:cell division protein FtsB
MSLRRSLAWLMPLGLLVYALVSVPVRILSEEGLPRYRRLSEQLQRLRSQNVELARNIERLNREVNALRSDPAAIERIARDELGLVQRGEIVFQFSDSR